MFLSSCKKNVDSEKIFKKSFYARDNEYILTSKENGITNQITIKLPDYCWNKQSGVIIDKNGKVFKKPDRIDSEITAFNPKLEKKMGKFLLILIVNFLKIIGLS